MSDLLAADGTILWPGTTAKDTRLLPARKDAEQAVALRRPASRRPTAKRQSGMSPMLATS